MKSIKLHANRTMYFIKSYVLKEGHTKTSTLIKLQIKLNKSINSRYHSKIISIINHLMQMLSLIMSMLLLIKIHKMKLPTGLRLQENSLITNSIAFMICSSKFVSNLACSRSKLLNRNTLRNKRGRFWLKRQHRKQKNKKELNKQWRTNTSRSRCFSK